MNLQGHEAAVWSVKMLPDKGLMLSGNYFHSICLWLFYILFCCLAEQMWVKS